MRTLIMAVAAGALAACAALSRDIDDNGAARRLIEEAPTDAPVEQTLAQPTLRVVDRTFGDVATAAPPPEVVAREAASCDAGQWAALVGRPLSSIDQRLLPEPYRVVCADCLVTQEYKFNRLNVYLDREERITRFVCG